MSSSAIALVVGRRFGPRLLGRTGLTVSRLGLGLAGLGRPAYMTLGRERDLGTNRSAPAMERRCHALLDEAYRAGVRYIDTARSYGLAEEFLASWCSSRRLTGEALTVGSKWGYTYTGGWQIDALLHEVKELTVGTLRRQVAESRSTLGRCLSLYQVHSATLESGVLDDHAVLTALVRLREQGLCIGLTVTGPRQSEVIRRALGIRVDGLHLFQTVQATWNLLEPSAGDALADAWGEGCGVIVKEALANGRLTDRHAGSHPRLQKLRAYAALRKTTIESIAMAAALNQPWADVVLSGALTTDQLWDDVAAMDLRPPIRPPYAIAESADQYWRLRQSLPWR
jgi:aryl-alcohol dehydrogenase-like predicted oxidoreductase